MARTGRRAALWALVVVPVFAIIIALLAPPSITSIPSHANTPAAAPATGKTCVPRGNVEYSNESGKEGPDAFGRNPDPTNRLSASQLAKVLKTSICHSKSLTLVYYHKVVDPHAGLNRHLTLSEWRREVKAIDLGIDWIAPAIQTNTAPKGTQTYEMIPQPHGPPIIRKAALAAQHLKSRFLILHVFTGIGREATLTVRIKCRFQPVETPADGQHANQLSAYQLTHRLAVSIG